MANILRFVILGDDRGGPAFATFTRQVEKANKAVDRNNAALGRQSAASKKSAGEVSKLSKAMDGLGRHAGPGWLGPALLALPAIGTLSGAAAGAVIGLGGAFAAGAGALAAFGAVAKPVLTDAKKASEAVSKAQDAYNTAVAGGTPKARAYKTEQIAIAKAYAGMSPAQIALSKQLGVMADTWDKVKKAQTPVISGALQPWLHSVTTLTRDLGPVIAKVAPVLGALGAQFDALVSSGAFVKFRDFIANTGSRAVGAAGNVVIALIQAFITLLPKFQPLIGKAVTGLAGLGPAIEKWASSKKTADQIQAFMAWFNKNGPAVGGFIVNIGKAVANLAPGLASGGALELKVISDFLGLVARLPKNVAGPLAEVAGAALILAKIPGGTKVMSFLVTGSLGGIFGKKGGATAGSVAESAAAGAGSAGLMSKLLGGGAKLVGAAFVVDVVVNILKGTSSGKGKNWFDNPFGMPGPKDKASADNWLTSWSPYLNRFKTNFSGMTSFVAGSWSKTASFLHGSWSQTVNFLSGSWTKLGQFIGGVLRAVSAAWNATWGALKGAFRVFVVTGILGPLGLIIHGAAAAFGWVPGLGGKLKGAAKQFDTFAANVNKSLGGINDKTIHVSVAMTSKTNPYPGGISGRRAAGGRITGPGGPAADKAGLYALSNNEWVIRANSASRYGLAAMSAVNEGRAVIGYAAGGGVNVAPHTPPAGAVESTLMASVTTLATAFAKAAQAAAQAANPFAGITGVPSGARISGSAQAAMNFARSILWAYGWGPGQFPPLQSLWMGESGWNYLAYNASSGATGIPQSLPGSKMASAGADWRTNPATQIRWGLGYIKQVYGSPANAYGFWLRQSPHWYDQGGYLPAGLSLAYNGTGRPEPVGPAAGGGGNTYNITVNVPPTASKADTGRVIVEHIREYERGSGARWRR